MNIHSKTILSAALATAFAAGTPVQAQTAKDFEDMRQEIKRLRDEVNELKKSKAAEVKPADASGWGDRIEALEIKSKDAVVVGDSGSGFRIPGSETSMRIYGYAEAHAIHDFKRTAPDDLFTNLPSQPVDSDVAANPSLGQTGATHFTAQTSRIGFETSTPTAAGPFNTKLEMDFYSFSSGNRNRLRLRQAYGEYAGWLVGQTWSTFMDLDDTPETVDFTGPIGTPFSRRAMVRYTYGDAKAGYKLSFAAESPTDQNGPGTSTNETMPQLVARFDQSADWGSFNVRGMAHQKRSLTEEKYGWGFGLGGNYKITDKDLLMAQYTIVDGDFDAAPGSNGYGIASDGTITFDRNQAFLVGYTKTFNDQFRSSVAYGINKARVATATSTPYDNRRLQQVFLNVFYTPIKNVELAAEYIWGLRQTYFDESSTMSRIDLMGRYSF